MVDAFEGERGNRPFARLRPRFQADAGLAARTHTLSTNQKAGETGRSGEAYKLVLDENEALCRGAVED